MSDERLHVEQCDEVWVLSGEDASGFGLVNEFLGHLADRNYSPRTRRAYAFDLLHFARGLLAEDLALDAVSTDVLLRYLAACRTAVLPGQPGGNVVSIRSGRSSGYAPSTINRRLAVISGMFEFRGMRDPEAASPVPQGAAARRPARGERGGELGHLAKAKPRSKLRLRQPRRLPRGLDREEAAALLGSFRSGLSELLGEQTWHESGLGAPEDIELLKQRIVFLERQAVDLRLQLDERDQELTAARDTNRELLTRLNDSRNTG